VIRIGINGLTCSACVKNVEMQIKKLPFVLGVHMDIIGTEAQVHVRQGKEFKLEKLVRAVYKAGFSVREVKALLNPKEIQFLEDYKIIWAGSEFVILNPNKIRTDLPMDFLWIVKKFIPDKTRQNILEENGILKFKTEDQFVLIL
jgi:copper chaperone CopZ